MPSQQQIKDWRKQRDVAQKYLEVVNKKREAGAPVIESVAKVWQQQLDYATKRLNEAGVE